MRHATIIGQQGDSVQRTCWRSAASQLWM